VIIISGITDAIFGSSPSSSYSNPYGAQATTTSNTLSSLLNQISANAPSTVTAGTNNLGTAATNATNLANGQLPSSYAAANQQSINNAVQNALGTGVANLAASGTLGGTSTSNLTNQIANSAANTMANNYNQNMSTANNINNSLAGIGSSQAGLGLNETSGLQGLLNSYLSQAQTTVNQGNSGLLGSAVSGGLLNGLF
jgi:hypothetical protein